MERLKKLISSIKLIRLIKNIIRGRLGIRIYLYL